MQERPIILIDDSYSHPVFAGTRSCCSYFLSAGHAHEPESVLGLVFAILLCRADERTFTTEVFPLILRLTASGSLRASLQTQLALLSLFPPS
jgi:hypothetical protein